jgi:hypothetical protein
MEPRDSHLLKFREKSTRHISVTSIVYSDKELGEATCSASEAGMLSKCRCPHTGVVNYFTKADPQLAVGSVAEAGDTTAYAWRCYVGEEAGGLAPDISRAEAYLRKALASAERQARSLPPESRAAGERRAL